MTMIYSILEADPPFPFKGYQATMKVEGEPGNMSKLHWSCQFLLREGASLDAAKTLISQVYGAGFNGLRKVVESA
jgi:hypothetical protein